MRQTANGCRTCILDQIFTHQSSGSSSSSTAGASFCLSSSFVDIFRSCLPNLLTSGSIDVQSDESNWMRKWISWSCHRKLIRSNYKAYPIYGKWHVRLDFICLRDDSWCKYPSVDLGQLVSVRGRSYGSRDNNIIALKVLSSNWKLVHYQKSYGYWYGPFF